MAPLVDSRKAIRLILRGRYCPYLTLSVVLIRIVDVNLQGMTGDKHDVYVQRAEATIVAGEMTISRQLALIEKLDRAGLSTDQARARLEEMESLLRRFYANREKLLRQ